jgi:glycine/D-amino acid oxidase-like deaminating enzyme
MAQTRRNFMKTALTATAMVTAKSALAAASRSSVVVVGAGAFGGWTALYLLRNGAKVTLVDAWGPGNSRASSGGETRIIRATYGGLRLYSQMATDALRLWQENERRWQRKLFFRTGVLWLAGVNDAYEQESMKVLKQVGAPFEKLSAAESARRWPQISFEGTHLTIFEPEAGYLLARRSCEAVLDAYRAEGGQYRVAQAAPGAIADKEMQGVQLNQSENLRADRYVFACGPWLPRVFPFLAGKIRPTKQEVFFFGTAAGDKQFGDEALPTWIDNGTRVFYGIPGNRWRGFKLACDERGPDFDPTDGERRITDEKLQEARNYMDRRFPGMRGAPLLESRVCQYENSSDQKFVLDRHPEAGNAWILGGGSGHGFKHGPALGLKTAKAVLDKEKPEGELSLQRLMQNHP